MVLLSVTGLFRTIFIIVGVMVILRFLNRLMTVKRNQTAAQEHLAHKERLRQAKEESERNKGKVHIIGKDNVDAEDVDYEEL